MRLPDQPIQLRTWSIILVCLTAFCARAEEKKDAEKKPDGSPAEEVVKDLMKKMWGTSSVGLDNKPYYEITIEYQTIKHGEPHEGTHRADGVPANTKTTVYPVKIDMIVTKKLISSGAVTKKRIAGKYGYFRDSFGDWDQRVQESTIEDLK